MGDAVAFWGAWLPSRPFFCGGSLHTHLRVFTPRRLPCFYPARRPAPRSHAACSYCWPEIATWLLSQGANPNLPDNDGDTPLFACESAACADLLLAAGADLFAANKAGHCAYFFAAWEERAEMLPWFAEKYAARGAALPPVPPDPEAEEGEALGMVAEEGEEGEEEEGEEGGAAAALGAGGGGGGGGGMEEGGA